MKLWLTESVPDIDTITQLDYAKYVSNSDKYRYLIEYLNYIKLDNMFSIGLMQGRMLPPDRFTYQNFPENNWKEEIDLIDKMGFDFVECLYDEDNKITL